MIKLKQYYYVSFQERFTDILLKRCIALWEGKEIMLKIISGPSAYISYHVDGILIASNA